MLLILVGMMMYELLRNMWGFEKPIKTAEFDTWLMDMILGWFEKYGSPMGAGPSGNGNLKGVKS